MDQYAVPVVWSPETRRHDPRHEVWVGVATEGTETAARVDAILDALRADGHDLVEATPQPDDALLAVHEPELLEFLRTAADRWAAGPYRDLVGQERVVPYLFPTPAMTAGLPARPAVAVHADAGRFAYDTMTLVGPGTWEAARAAADCAVQAAGLVTGGARAGVRAVPPARPPRDARRASAAPATSTTRRSPPPRSGRQERQRVGIVDIDAHQGNGTAAIFYDRADVLYGSVHVDPAAGWFPHVVGYADETGVGAGEGATRNLPLPEGTGDEPWLAAVAELAEWVTGAGCDHLVVSLGVDAAADDPESPLQVTADGYREAGRLLGATGLPAVAVQEGGYHLPTLGGLVAAYLDGHASAQA